MPVGRAVSAGKRNYRAGEHGGASAVDTDVVRLIPLLRAAAVLDQRSAGWDDGPADPAAHPRPHVESPYTARADMQPRDGSQTIPASYFEGTAHRYPAFATRLHGAAVAPVLGSVVPCTATVASIGCPRRHRRGRRLVLRGPPPSRAAGTPVDAPAPARMPGVDAPAPSRRPSGLETPRRRATRQSRSRRPRGGAAWKNLPPAVASPAIGRATTRIGSQRSPIALQHMCGSFGLAPV